MTAKFLGSFMGDDVVLDDVKDAVAIALIDHLTKEVKHMRGDSVDAAMYRLTNQEGNTND